MSRRKTTLSGRIITYLALFALDISGPSGSGKSTVYQEMLKLGGFMPDLKAADVSKEQVCAVIEKAAKNHREIREFCWLLEYCFRLGEDGERYLQRTFGVLFGLYKLILAYERNEGMPWTIINGGPVHRAVGLNALSDKMPLGLYYERMPPPQAVVLLSANRDALIERNKARGKDDRSADVDRMLSIYATAKGVLKARDDIETIEIDTTDYAPELVAASILDHFGIKRNFGGPVAAGYNKKRENQPKWQVEQRQVEDALSDLPAGTIVLDVPVGAGRFLHLYAAKNFHVYGIDKDEDMLAEARKVAASDQELTQGDITDLKYFGQGSVDVSVMVRMTRWLSPAECIQAMKELCRVTRKRIIWTARVAESNYARPLSLFRPLLIANGWKIVRDEAGYEPSYRMFVAEKV